MRHFTVTKIKENGLEKKIYLSDKVERKFIIYRIKDLTNAPSIVRYKQVTKTFCDYYIGKKLKMNPNFRIPNFFGRRSLAQIPSRVINIFWDLVLKDMILNGVEFCFSKKQVKENEFVMRIGYDNVITNFGMKNGIARSFYIHEGKRYRVMIKTPLSWTNSNREKGIYLMRKYRKMVIENLKKGYKYYNSEYERLMSIKD